MTGVALPQTGTHLPDPPSARIYLDFYRLAQAPFSITPDPGFLYYTRCHQQVLDKITYAIESRMGFTLLTGEVGTGKTTVCRTLLDRLAGKAETAYVINPSLSEQELLAGILEDLGVVPQQPASKKTLLDQLNQRLLTAAAARPVVVIIDDAQTMPPQTMEALRLLSNLETDKHKLIQVVLSGQPELLEMLSSPQLRQLKQRIGLHCRLEPLSAAETGAYIAQRLFVAGNSGQVGFSTAAVRLIHHFSGGIPRLINKICDYALTAGYIGDAPTIGRQHVKQAMNELDDLGGSAADTGRRILGYRFSGAAALLVLGALFWFMLGSGASTMHKPIPTGTLRSGDLSPAPPAGTPASPNPATYPDPAPILGPAPPDSPDEPAVATAAAVVSGPLESPPPHRPPPSPIGMHPVPPAPYTLQLASFRRLAEARNSAAHYREKGIAASWQATVNGRWYRVLAGKFENLDQAAQYQRDHDLDEALAVRAPWSVMVLPKLPETPVAEIGRFLAELGYDSLMQTGPWGDTVITTGFFTSVDGAAKTADQINRSSRYLARVVAR